MQRVDRDTSADTLYTARSAKKRNCCHMRTSWYPVVTRGSTEEAIPGDETRGVVERVREHALIVGAEETVTAGGGVKKEDEHYRGSSARDPFPWWWGQHKSPTRPGKTALQYCRCRTWPRSKSVRRAARSTAQAGSACCSVVRRCTDSSHTQTRT